jgi:hypothetical protein
MRRPTRLRQIVRTAVLNALAAGCATPLGCGAATELPEPLDAGPADGATGDVATDGSVIDALVDVAPPGCTLRYTGDCAEIFYSCLPPGLVAGPNNGGACDVQCGPNSSCYVRPTGNRYGVSCTCFTGRVPAGLELGGTAGGTDPVGVVLARNAALEAAAVIAFDQLAVELEVHGAPATLVQRARRAARQETRHARMLGRAAAARGCEPPAVRIPPPAPPRTLRAIAEENAVEGCGREAIGAAVLELQSLRAADPALRRMFARIADDEAEHAELAFDVQAWLEPQLDAPGRAAVRAAREHFFALCERAPREDSGGAALGVPSGAEWAALVTSMRDGLHAIAA